MTTKILRTVLLGGASVFGWFASADAATAALAPGSRAASAALAFDPFSKTATAGANTSVLTYSAGSAAVAAPALVKAESSPTSPLPGTTVSIGDVAIIEGDTGHFLVGFPVTLSKQSPVPVQVNYSTRAGSAKGNHADFEDTFGTVTFPAGSQLQYITVRIENDKVPEPTETFFVDLTNARPSPVTIARKTGTGTIFDNDKQKSQPTLTLASQSGTTVTEPSSGTKAVNFKVYLSETPQQNVVFDYATADGSATSKHDYVATSGSQTFAKGTTALARGFSVSILGESNKDNGGTFTVKISNPTSNATISNGSVQITIKS
jgi:hypothetical protein